MCMRILSVFLFDVNYHFSNGVRMGGNGGEKYVRGCKGIFKFDVQTQLLLKCLVSPARTDRRAHVNYSL